MVVALAATVVEAGYFFRVVQGLYFKKGAAPGSAREAKEAPAGALIPIVVLAVLIVVIGVYPHLVTGLLQHAADELVNRGAYIKSVLGAS